MAVALQPIRSKAEAHGPANPATPYLDLDLGIALDQFVALAAALPGTAIHYAVKANPHPDLLRALYAAGSRFDVASPAELVGGCDRGDRGRHHRRVR